MSPPTEQLIRDYLNRLSVAARGQLGPDDRRALVSRTRDFIERKTGFGGPPTALDVARLLSGLGDPAGLVQQERQRLAAVRGDVPEPTAGRARLARVMRRDQGKPRSASWHWPVQEGSRADLQLTLLDGAGAGAEDSAGQDAGAGQEDRAGQEDSAGQADGAGQEDSAGQADGAGQAEGTVLTETAVNGSALETTAPDTPAPETTFSDTPAPDPRDPDGTGQEYEAPSSANGTARLVPEQGGEPSWFMQSLGSRTSARSRPSTTTAEEAQPEAGQSKPRWPSLASGDGPDQSGDSAPAVDGGAEPAQLGARRFAAGSHGSDEAPADVAPAQVTPAWRLTMPTESVLARRARPAARGVVSWYRRYPLEASAVVLLGIGGPSYPPVWLLGAAFALASRLWDYRDKWVGLAVPLLVTVIGAAFGVTRGGHVSVGQGVHEGWVYAVVISRIAAALGASFLTWRTLHGRRQPPVPPWNRPHKIG